MPGGAVQMQDLSLGDWQMVHPAGCLHTELCVLRSAPRQNVLDENRNSPPTFTDSVSISVGRAQKCCLKGQKHPPKGARRSAMTQNQSWLPTSCPARAGLWSHTWPRRKAGMGGDRGAQ